MKISPAAAGFIKGVGLAILFAGLTYFANASNFTGIVPASVAAVIAGFASLIESSLKSNSGNSTALFGAVKLTKSPTTYTP